MKPKPETNKAPPVQSVDPATPLFGVWQPFATVPRDGTWVIITCGGICQPTVAAWEVEEEAWINGDDQLDTEENWPLSHWMPMPPAPLTRDAIEDEAREWQNNQAHLQPIGGNGGAQNK